MYTNCEICVAVFDRFYSFFDMLCKDVSKTVSVLYNCKVFSGFIFRHFHGKKGCWIKHNNFFFTVAWEYSQKEKEHGKFMKLYKSRVTPIKEKGGTLSLLTFPIQLNSRVLIYKGPLFSHPFP